MKTIQFNIPRRDVTQELIDTIAGTVGTAVTDGVNQTIALETDAYTISLLQSASHSVFSPALTTDIELESDGPDRKFVGKCSLPNGVMLHVYWKF